MTVTPAASTTTTGTTNQPDAMKRLSSNFSTFLTLLTTQLKNQDPTSPMDSNEFTQQLVMYSQVEQQITSNDNLKTLISQGTSNAATMASAYLGKKVSVTTGNASLSGVMTMKAIAATKTSTPASVLQSPAKSRIAPLNIASAPVSSVVLIHIRTPPTASFRLRSRFLVCDSI